METKAVDVAATATLVLDANADRIMVVFVNNSDTDIALCPGGHPVDGEGLVLQAPGGSWTSEPFLFVGPGQRIVNKIYKGVYMAIHGGAGNKSLAVTEWSEPTRGY